MYWMVLPIRGMPFQLGRLHGSSPALPRLRKRSASTGNSRSDKTPAEGSGTALRPAMASLATFIYVIHVSLGPWGCTCRGYRGGGVTWRLPWLCNVGAFHRRGGEGINLYSVRGWAPCSAIVGSQSGRCIGGLRIIPSYHMSFCLAMYGILPGFGLVENQGKAQSRLVN